VLEELEDRVTPSGAPPYLGAEFRVDPAAGSPAIQPTVAVNAAGDSIVVWENAVTTGPR